MNKTEALKDTRTSFRALAAALGAAGALTATIIWPDVSAELVAVWSGVWMAAIGFGEALFDHRSTQ